MKPIVKLHENEAIVIMNMASKIALDANYFQHKKGATKEDVETANDIINNANKIQSYFD